MLSFILHTTKRFYLNSFNLPCFRQPFLRLLLFYLVIPTWNKKREVLPLNSCNIMQYIFLTDIDKYRQTFFCTPEFSNIFYYNFLFASCSLFLSAILFIFAISLFFISSSGFSFSPTKITLTSFSSCFSFSTG